MHLILPFNCGIVVLPWWRYKNIQTNKSAKKDFVSQKTT